MRRAMLRQPGWLAQANLVLVLDLGREHCGSRIRESPRYRYRTLPVGGTALSSAVPSGWVMTDGGTVSLRFSASAGRGDNALSSLYPLGLGDETSCAKRGRATAGLRIVTGLDLGELAQRRASL